MPIIEKKQEGYNAMSERIQSLPVVERVQERLRYFVNNAETAGVTKAYDSNIAALINLKMGYPETTSLFEPEALVEKWFKDEAGGVKPCFRVFEKKILSL